MTALEYPPLWEGVRSKPTKQRAGIRDMEQRFIERMMQHHANRETTVRGLARLSAPPKPAPIQVTPPDAEAWGEVMPLAPYDVCEAPAPETVAPNAPSVPSSKAIIMEVCRKRDVAYREIVGETRQTRIVHARAEACYRLREERQLSWAQIGRLVGGKDHTTALHNYRKHAERLRAATLVNETFTAGDQA